MANDTPTKPCCDLHTDFSRASEGQSIERPKSLVESHETYYPEAKFRASSRNAPYEPQVLLNLSDLLLQHQVHDGC